MTDTTHPLPSEQMQSERRVQADSKKIGNLTTIVALSRSVKLRVHATTAFIISLSVSDLLFCTINLPLTASRYIHEAWVLGDALCSVFPFFFYGNVAVSLLNLVAITVNRSCNTRSRSCSTRSRSCSTRSRSCNTRSRLYSTRNRLYSTSGTQFRGLLVSEGVPTAKPPGETWRTDKVFRKHDGRRARPSAVKRDAIHVAEIQRTVPDPRRSSTTQYVAEVSELYIKDSA
ncbi:G protein-coupled receptor rhodopsin-like [Trinorchestia longiramus]|nr:G protein-coupled receptor rhodopsin-like [Trinorchestia longiramus]